MSKELEAFTETNGDTKVMYEALEREYWNMVDL